MSKNFVYFISTSRLLFLFTFLCYFFISLGSISISPISTPLLLSYFSHDIPSSLLFSVLFVLPHPPCSSSSSLIFLCRLPSLNPTHTILYPQPSSPLTAYFFAEQEVLPDRKRVTTRSYLPLTPADTDSGRNFTCVASNPAVPMGKRATVTLNVHRMLPFFFVKV